ncbi:isochorismatase family protein family [Talaromyces stipitatus ATCC 10500]|uniref:Isochorismatase family protein family n=1 Tax=Talaromyces stipitatus (strain ATCC 10500 / CBS 375.48 / QM 6759 / NRRL 1006) TaxID=441959 RepID=B8MTE5_TALSN|nr:isochorismatase family protein family [Talaromyces stipitatus ATCC 10500]EED12190.1 isochorismatase family protein family [Talaromyces stipitatus ATCC 10500]
MNPLALFSSIPNLPSIETRKALLLLDFQNDFVRPNGRLPVRKTLDFIDLIPGLVQSFRRTGEIVWVRTQYEGPRPVIDDYGSEIVITSAGPLDTKNPRKGRRGRQDSRANVDGNVEVDPEAFLSGPEPACLPQTAGVQFPAPILAAIDHEHDIIIEKSDYSALQSPGLVLSLRSRFVTELYICGSLSNVSVYATALEAAQQGFTITLIEDCMGYRSFARHEEAVRRLADIVGANGISVQELLEEEEWEETQEIAHATSPAPGSNTNTLAQQSSMTPPSGIENVLDHLAVQNSPVTKRSSIAEQTGSTPSTNSTAHVSGMIEADDDPYDDDDIVLPPIKYTRASSTRVTREQTPRPSSTKLRRHKSGNSPSSSRRPGSAASDTVFLGRASTSPVLTTTNKVLNAASPGSPAPALPPVTEASYAKKKKKIAKDDLGPDDTIAEGDSRIVYNLDLPTDAFEKIQEEVNWQKMYHLSGQVPRLVAVQGAVNTDKSFPIYRHPADESPILEPFTETVTAMYRDGQDNISEHSDKTLDIVRGSSIVNVSLGAQRTMTLRTKKTAPADGGDGRQKQQVPMPHGSMFILGPQSNTRWLHGIRPDKRQESEKSFEEKAYNGERISLTFRNIGTFINPEQGTIWGQGAVSKRADAARKVIHGDPAEAERLIRAFGSENRETEFDWDAVYGQGFDVVNFVEPMVARLTLSGDPIADMRVRLCLTENGMRYEVVHPPKTMDMQPLVYTSPDGETMITGDIQILLYLASLDPNSSIARPGVGLVRGGNHLIEITRLETAWHEYVLSGSKAEFSQLPSWNERLRETEVTSGQHYIAGQTLTIDDLALWPILHQIESRKEMITGSARYPYLSAYYHRIEKRGCVRVVMDEIGHERGRPGTR